MELLMSLKSKSTFMMPTRSTEGIVSSEASVIKNEILVPAIPVSVIPSGVENVVFLEKSPIEEVSIVEEAVVESAVVPSDPTLSVEDYIASKNLNPRVAKAVIAWYKYQGLHTAMRSHFELLYDKVK